ncbi:hypothetical protein NDN08_006308 [Rhodosorus marinus]|uniref:TLC domain-containing protein n=1 Tax=Rhodosorus marinus TaxID=101924 RepID=A0AAV8UKF9_9RHOD|nr:hypothetical protein NDN08_006308 [Rhodosorus marinus]
MMDHLTPFERHDLFNIFGLFPFSAMNFFAFGNRNLQKPTLMAFGAYTVADIMWVLTIPKSVKDPKGIIMHHMLSLGLLTVPTLLPEYRHYAVLTLTAEFNTWLLVTKRHVTWKPLRLALEGLFYTSWVGIRLVLYPWLWSRYFTVTLRNIRNGLWIHPTIISPIVMGSLCLMQFKWSWDLIQKYVLRRKKKGSD